MTRYKTDDLAARAWAKRKGIVGVVGGWLYLPGHSAALCQGYGQLAGILRRHDAIRRDEDGKWWIANQDLALA